MSQTRSVTLQKYEIDGPEIRGLDLTISMGLHKGEYLEHRVWMDWYLREKSISGNHRYLPEKTQEFWQISHHPIFGET